ncbi:hypothetical protein E2C01_008697 [Portunus trituberculatus]|uniref:Uncharacterized protein n=4 Tax=Portunus trituberculatus TaxID=210409 RepID=A0A5B7D5K6_PORTR|nr:hypothetical protein [Portunus trituberculatus]
MSGTTLHEQHQHNQLQTGFEDDDEEEEEEEEVGEDLLEVSQNNKVSESNDLIQPLRDLNLTSSRPEGEVKEGAFEEVNLLGDY